MKVLYLGHETEEFTHGGEYELVTIIVRPCGNDLVVCIDENGNNTVIPGTYELIK